MFIKVGLPYLTKFGFVPWQAPCSDPQRPKYTDILLYLHISLSILISIYIYICHHFGENCLLTKQHQGGKQQACALFDF